MTRSTGGGSGRPSRGRRQRLPGRPEAVALSARCVRIGASSTVESHGEVSLVSVALARMHISDADISRRVIPLLEQTLLVNNSPSHVYWVNLDLSENNLADEGLLSLTNWWRRHLDVLRIRTLKLYKNIISDGGASGLASLIAEHCWPIEELHLSHNAMTDRGALAVLRAFLAAETSQNPPHPPNSAVRSQFVYPRLEPSRRLYLPVWVRLEYNYIREPDTVLTRLAEGLSARSSSMSGSVPEASQEPAICFAERAGAPSMKDPNCSPKRCAKSSGSSAPLVHLFSFSHQLAPRRNSECLVQPMPVPQGGSHTAPNTSAIFPKRSRLSREMPTLVLDGSACLALGDADARLGWRFLAQRTLGEARLVLFGSAEAESRLLGADTPSDLSALSRVDDDAIVPDLDVGISPEEESVGLRDFEVSTLALRTLDSALRWAALEHSSANSNASSDSDPRTYVLVTNSRAVVWFADWLAQRRKEKLNVTVAHLSQFDDAVAYLLSESNSPKHHLLRAALTGLISNTPRLMSQRNLPPPLSSPTTSHYQRPSVNDNNPKPPGYPFVDHPRAASDAPPPPFPSQRDHPPDQAPPELEVSQAISSLSHMLHLLVRVRRLLGPPSSSAASAATEGAALPPGEAVELIESCLRLGKQLLCQWESHIYRRPATESPPQYFPQLVSKLNTLIQGSVEPPAHFAYH